MIGGDADEAGNIMDVRRGFIGLKAPTFRDAGVEADGGETIAEHPPHGLDAAGAADIDQRKLFVF